MKSLEVSEMTIQMLIITSMLDLVDFTQNFQQKPQLVFIVYFVKSFSQKNRDMAYLLISEIYTKMRKLS